jgi:hypothetical protein
LKSNQPESGTTATSAGGNARAGFLFVWPSKKMQTHQQFLRGPFPDRVGRQILVALVCAFFLGAHPVFADDSAGGTEQPANASNYFLVGIAQIDGISYASLVDRQTNYHYLLSTAKSDEGLVLTSIADDGATVKKDGVAIFLKLGCAASLDQSNSTSSSLSLTNSQPTPLSVSVANLKPPPGASLPLAFQARDAKGLHLTDDQKATLTRLQQNFVDAINGTGSSAAGSTASGLEGNNPTPPAGNQTTTLVDPMTMSPAQQLKNWRAAQLQSDAIFIMEFGTQAFEAAQLSTSN